MKAYRWILTLAVLTSTVMTGCQKKGDSGGSAPIAGPVQPVVTLGCGNNAPGFLASASGTGQTMSGQQITALVNFLGDPSRVNPGDANVITGYRGPGTLIGQLSFSGTGNNGMGICGVTPGTYSFQYTAASELVYGAMSGGTFVAQGGNGGTIQATVSLATITGVDMGNLNGRCSTTNRALLNIRLDVVNGQPCGMTISTY